MSAIEYQRVILSDKIRNGALAKAIKLVIKPGCTVIDIGAGSGFLSFLAKQYGAGQCILIERDPDSVSLARKLIEKNHLSGCKVIHAHSTEVKTLPKADVVISETLGNFAYEENIIETLKDAHRFLVKGGTMIPQRITQFAAPVTSADVCEEIRSWDDVGFGIDWAPARERSANNMYVKSIPLNALFNGSTSSAMSWDTVDLTDRKNESIRTSEVTWQITGDHEVHGFALWWICELVPGITLSTAPDAPPTHWKQIFLPVPHPIVVKNGEKITLSITSDSRWSVKINVSWEVEKYSMDMRRG